MILNKTSPAQFVVTHMVELSKKKDLHLPYKMFITDVFRAFHIYLYYKEIYYKENVEEASSNEDWEVLFISNCCLGRFNMRTPYKCFQNIETNVMIRPINTKLQKATFYSHCMPLLL